MLLIVGAFPPETELLEDLNGSGVAIQSAGIGPVEALLGLEALVMEFAPDEIVFLGSCGQYKGAASVSYVSGELFTFLDPASLLGRSRMVPAMRKYAAPKPGEFGKLCTSQPDFTPAIVNTTLSLSLEDHALSLPLLEQAIEGLEAGILANPELAAWKQQKSEISVPVMENLEVFGIMRGYSGLLEGSFVEMNASSVGNIMQHGGTILQTSRCKEFHKKEAYSDQKNTYSSFIKSEIFIDFKNDIEFLMEPYFRYDHHDKNRSLFNFKENNFAYYYNDIQVKAGISEVFWGITESKNLVNIINVKDVTDGDQKAKLGQSLLAFSNYSEKYGSLDFYYLPFFKNSSQIGQTGRLRLSKPIENYDIVYEGGAGSKVPSWAIKWENSFGMLDFSLQGFRGNSRESSTIAKLENLQLKYFQGYERISQLGTYLQVISGPTIYKVEAIKRNGQKNAKNIRENFYSYTLGMEYLINNLFENKWDLTSFIEYHNDDRNNDSTDIFQNDLFLATRLNFNDTDGTEFLTSITLDTDGGGNTSTLELSSRITDNIRVTGSYNAYWSVNEKDILYSFRRDNYFLINITNYF